MWLQPTLPSTPFLTAAILMLGMLMLQRNSKPVQVFPTPNFQSQEVPT